MCSGSLRCAARTAPALLALLVLPAVARAQDNERPRIERLTFRGVESVRESDLRESIVTEQTSCISFVLRPLCAITAWGLLLDEHFLDREAVREDELRLRVYYFQRGFRRAWIAAEIRPRGRGVEVLFNIEEGPPTVIEVMAVEQRRDVLSDRRIRRARLPREGDPLDLLQLNRALADLATAYGQRGYLDVALRDSIMLTTDGLAARVAVVLEPKPRATLDTLVISGNERVSDRVIEEALRLRLGRVLRTGDVAASQRSLYDSNLFHEARVRVPPQPDSAKLVEVRVREAPPRNVTVGGGFNTVEFLQLDTRLTHFNFLGGSRRLDLRGTIGNLLAAQLNGNGIFRDVVPVGPSPVDDRAFLHPTWQASVEFRQPAFRSAANVLSMAVFTHRRAVLGVAIDDGYGADISLTRRLDYPTPLTAAYRFELTSVRAGDLYFCVHFAICEPVTIAGLRERHRLSPVSVSLVDDRSDDPIAPSTGYRLRAELEHASGLTLSDFGYHRFSGAGAYYLPLDLDRRRILAARVRAGVIHALEGTARALGIDEETERIAHPRKRFYSGGARSVRGYRENQLGPRILTVDPNVLRDEAGCTDAGIAAGACDPADAPVDRFLPRPVGGAAVIEANAEYRFPIGRHFQGAVFVDGAAVGDGLVQLVRGGSRAVTPGFGARWGSPVGPIRVDLGIRPWLTEELPVVTEITDAEGLRQLVRLAETRRYNPLDDTRGFLRQVLARLVLHLAIGEAF